MRENISMIETFSGIGSQYLGFKNSDCFNVDVIATSDIDKDAILSYAIIHCNLTDKINTYDYPSIEKMVYDLSNMNIGYNYDRNIKYNWSKHLKNGKYIIKKYWLACHLSKQVGDISLIDTLPYADILTFSFPCQNISTEGKQEGIINGETKSGLVYDIFRILKNMKIKNELPKYLLLENVKNLISEKFINDFKNFNNILDEFGYNCYWDILNGKDCGVPQNRERVFGIYIRKDIDNYKFEFPKKFDNGIRLKDILDEFYDNSYIIKNNKTIKENINCRKLTPFEFWKLMGFKKEMCYDCYNYGVPKSKLYKQAGNTIIVDCIELLAQRLYKGQFNNEYITKDQLLSGKTFKNNNIIVVGNYMESNYNSSRVLDVNGISPTIKENHGTIYAIKI